MRKQLREYLRSGATTFVDSVVKDAGDQAGMVIGEAIEAIREEARGRGYGEVKRLTRAERDVVIRGLIALDLADARNKFDDGKGELVAWLRHKLVNHVPYHTLSDGVLAALAGFTRGIG